MCYKTEKSRVKKMEKAKWKEGTFVGQTAKTSLDFYSQSSGNSGLLEEMIPSRGNAKVLVQVAILVFLKGSQSEQASLSCSFLCGQNGDNSTTVKDGLWGLSESVWEQLHMVNAH